MTKNQLISKYKREKIKCISKTPALKGCPQKGGVVVHLYYTTPKKPNSAIRKFAKLYLTTGKHVFGYIPGEGHNIDRFDKVLIRGGRVQDVIGAKYKIIRNAKGYALAGVKNRKSARSRYGVKKKG